MNNKKTRFKCKYTSTQAGTFKFERKKNIYRRTVSLASTFFPLSDPDARMKIVSLFLE